jgi:hypothetical protein
MNWAEQTTRVYYRCNGGEYFEARLGACPWDGWADPGCKEVAGALTRLMTAGESVSIVALLDAGASEAALHRTLVIEFGATASAFDALVPAYYVFRGEHYANTSVVRGARGVCSELPLDLL